MATRKRTKGQTTIYFNFPMFWKLNLRKKYEKISVNAFDYGKLHEIPKICKHWNCTFKTGFYWGIIIIFESHIENLPILEL
jgi:hypothetical protein